MNRSRSLLRNVDADWKAQCERGLERSVEDRIKYGFVQTYKPVLDDAPHRSWRTMKEYREWCHFNLPRYLGYRIVGREEEG